MNRSCHVALLGKKAFAEMYATTPMAETKASEYAEVAVKNGRTSEEVAIIVPCC